MSREEGQKRLESYRRQQEQALAKKPPDLEKWKALESKIQRIKFAQKGGATMTQARIEANRRNIRRRWELYRARKAREKAEEGADG